MKKFLLVVVIVLLMTGCSIFPTTTDVCSTTTEPSILCDIALKNHVKLEDVAVVLVIANAVAISEGAYSSDDAVKVLTVLRDSLDNPVSYRFIRDEIRKRVVKHPGLLIASEIYLNQFTSTRIMYPFDRDLLQSWFDTQIKSLQ